MYPTHQHPLTTVSLQTSASHPPPYLEGELAQNPEAPLQQHRLVGGHVQLVNCLLKRRVGVLVRPELDAVGLQLDWIIHDALRSYGEQTGGVFVSQLDGGVAGKQNDPTNFRVDG